MHRLVPFFVVLAAILALERPAMASGTNFLVQLQGGLAAPPLEHLDLAFGFGIAAGYGGRLRGTPLRFYGVVGYDRAAFSAAGIDPRSGGRWSSERSYDDLQVGLRVVVPVFWHLRWYVEGLGGASQLDGRVDRQDASSLTTKSWAGLVTGATGLELRWHRNLATAVRGEVRWRIVDADALAAAVCDDGDGSLRFTVLLAQSVMF